MFESRVGDVLTKRVVLLALGTFEKKQLTASINITKILLKETYEQSIFKKKKNAFCPYPETKMICFFAALIHSTCIISGTYML